MRTLRPVHAAVMLLAGFVAGQAIGGVLAIVGFAIAVATGSIDRSAFDGDAGLLSIMANPLILLPSAVGSSIGLVAIAIGTPLVLRVPIREALALRRPPPLAWILAPVGALGCAVVADQIVFYFGRAFPWLTLGALAAFGEVARTQNPFAAAAIWFGMAIVPGTCEELFFRGAVQGAFAARWRGAGAIAATALAFGVIHVDPPQAIGAGLLGAWLGFVTHRARSVGPAVAAHVVNNSLAFLSANLGAVAQYGYGTPNPVPWPIVGGGAAVAILTGLFVTRLRPRDPQ